MGALLGHRPRQLFELPDGLTVTASAAVALPKALRRRLVGWLAERVKRKAFRGTVATALGIAPASLEGHLTWEGAASAALVAATGDDDRVEAASRVVRALRDAFDEEPELLAELDRLYEELEGLRPEGGGLVDVWLERVRGDHSSLVPFFEHADLEAARPGLRPARAASRREVAARWRGGRNAPRKPAHDP